ncbi:MAG TPA: UDP-N-acetylenolpyruvoylglucosamine reductase, partial [Ruminococcaceae bacterium]|nr:UDP-N-acetylenolpyruvoylglucosamine reductase [Oscillospiraceae bacterium]
EFPSAGSVFKRPLGSFAGKLIEDCGLKGMSVGGAAVSEKHAGFIINKGGATSDDIKKLIDIIKNTVYCRTGIMLECEIKFIG